jgi:hypothetical protein
MIEQTEAEAEVRLSHIRDLLKTLAKTQVELSKGFAPRFRSNVGRVPRGYPAGKGVNRVAATSTVLSSDIDPC